MSALVPGAGPLYSQVRELLTRRVIDGQWTPGQLIPSEHRLAGEMGVSQGTVRKAVDEMVASNILVRQQGKGTFVSTHERRRAQFHFLNITDEDGRKALPESRVISLRRGRATRREAQALRLAPSATVVRIERVRTLNGVPTIAETIVVEAARFPRLLSIRAHDLPNALYALYETDFGIIIHRADERLRAVSASRRDQTLLNVSNASPLLEIERIARTVKGDPAELRVSRMLTTAHHYQASIE